MEPSFFNIVLIILILFRVTVVHGCHCCILFHSNMFLTFHPQIFGLFPIFSCYKQCFCASKNIPVGFYNTQMHEFVYGLFLELLLLVTEYIHFQLSQKKPNSFPKWLQPVFSLSQYW